MDALHEGGRSSSKPVFEAVLASPNGEVRAFAAKQLAMYKSSEALQASSSSADPRVREQVAVALGSRMCARVIESNGATQQYSYDPRSLSKGQRETLVRLVADPDTEVRVAAASSIVSLETPLDDKVYERIGKDADSRVRATLLQAQAVPVPVQARIALTLASDTDLGVLRSFDSFASSLALSEEPLDPAYLPAIEARLRNTTIPFQLTASGNVQHQFYTRVLTTPEGLTALARWSVEIRDTLAGYAVRNIVDRVGRRNSTTNQPWPRRTVDSSAVGVRLSPQELAALFKLVASMPGDMNERDLVPSLILLDDDLAPAFLPLARDAKLDRQVRLQALDVAARGQAEQVSDCLLQLMADPGWASSNVKQLSQHAGSIGNAMQREEAERTLDKLFDGKKQLHPILASSFVNGFAMAKPLDARTADRVLAAWFDNREIGSGVLTAALKQVASRPREAQGDWLIRAAHDARFWSSALTWMGDLRDPSYLGVLEEGLSKGLATEDPFASQECALNALTRYFSEPAAEIILKVAGATSNSELRGRCFKALDTIRQYKEEKGRWDDDRTSKEATAAAVRDLVTLLDDTNPAVRAQAVRGLGTLHAIEQMPRIVRALKDADESVRKAAEETLQVLNAPPAKKN
jgi:HEAT repeat protein